jgi:hypothetical protein
MGPTPQSLHFNVEGIAASAISLARLEGFAGCARLKEAHADFIWLKIQGSST